MALEWYIDAGGRVEGPVSADELNGRVAAGTLAPTDSVSADRITWVPANTVPELTFPERRRQPLLETVVSGSVHAAPAGTDDGPAIVPVVAVADYELLDTLGTGACGVVYKARQKSLNRIVALKTILVPEKASADLLNRFKLEAKALARLQHPHIVTVYGSGECEMPSGQVYFAMELLDGEDLSVRLDRAGPMDERTAWLVARQAAAALAHAAEHGIVHRDVKPANLFLVPPPTGYPLPPGVPMVKVTDFGLALSHAEGDQRQSVAGTLLGTPVYMAPEQFVGSDVDARADIYGLGCTIYHALTGAPPFDGRTVWDVMMKKSAPAPRLAEPISPESADLVEAMLAIDLNARPHDYTDLLARIDALPCLDSGRCSVRLPGISGRMPAPPAPEPVLPPPVPLARPRRRWAYVLAAVALLGAGAGIAVLAGAFDRALEKAEVPVPPGPEPEPPAPQPATPRSQELYKSGSLIGWTPDGGSLEIEREKGEEPALAAHGAVVRKFVAPPAFCVTLSIDPRTARTVDVVIATSGQPGEGFTQWVVRLTRPPKGRGTAAFGTRVGGAFTSVGTALPIPSAEDMKGRPYRELKYERKGGTLTAWFHGQRLGDAPDTGLATTEVRVEASGAIRIDYAALEEVTEPK